MTDSLPALIIDLAPARPYVLRCALWCNHDAPAISSLPVSAALRLPFGNASVRTIVLPGVLEWLGAPEAYGLLLDCHRVLAAGGRLVLDLPAADAALAAWRAGDADRVRQIAAVPDAELQTWAAAGVADTIDTRTAAVFCAHRRAGPPAYAGPPALEPAALRAQLARWTPFRLAVELRHAILDREPRFQLARRSAWGRDELTRDVRRAGFHVHSFEPAIAARALAGVPHQNAVPPDGGGRLWCVAEPMWPVSRPGLSARDELCECQQALAFEAGRAFRHYRLLWARFTRAIEEAALAITEPSFRDRGYFVAQLPEYAIRGFRASLDHAPPILLDATDYAPGYMYNDALSPEAEAVINQCSIFLQLGPEQRRCLAPVLQALAIPVRACLGTGFRVVNTRCWKTPTTGLQEETQTWHKDEMHPREMLKAMVYLSPVGGAYGSTELALDDGTRVIPEGPPGTVLMFRNSELSHRGVAPRGQERMVLEFTLAPWPENDLHPRHGGLNAEFPILPWDPLDGC